MNILCDGLVFYGIVYPVVVIITTKPFWKEAKQALVMIRSSKTKTLTLLIVTDVPTGKQH